MARADADLRDALAELIAIPSVSADPDRRRDIVDAADWVAGRIEAAGGDVRIQPGEYHPMVIADLAASASASSRPTVLCYGHYDVQPPGDPGDWETDPFVLTEAGEWLYGRGVADDKGPFFMLLEAARRLRGKGSCR